MKIIHCADIHLGARMRTHLSLEQALQRKEELLKTFCDMIEYAQNNDVRAILIAGDLLDTNSADIKTRNVVIDIITSHPDIDFYYLCGNHDRHSLIKLGDVAPANLHTFGTDWTSFNLDGAILTGAILGENNAELYAKLDLDPKEYNIVMLHGGETHGADYTTPDTVNFDALKDKNIDYLALGHIHTFRTGKLDRRATYAYSGCLEGRGFDECGEKGFVLLDLQPNEMTMEFVPFSKRRLHEIEVDITDCHTMNELSTAFNQQVAPILSSDLVRVIFVGEYDPDTHKYLSLVAMDAKKKFYYFTFKDKTTPRLDLEKLQNDVSLAGEFLRSIRQSNLPREEQDEIILLGLKALNGEEVEE